MAVLADFIKSIRAIFLNQSTTISNIVATLLVFGLEALVSSEKLFVCPSRGYKLYGWLAIFAPAGIFTLVSMLFRDDFRKLAQGCCHQRPDLTKDAEGCAKQCPRCARCCAQCFPWRRPRWKQCSMKMVRIFLHSLVAGCLWIFWAFFQREYYACAVVGNKDFKLNNAANENEKQNIKKQFTEAYDDSQFISLVFLGVLLGGSLLVLTICHCCYQELHSSLPKPEKYRKLEAQAAATAFNDKMEEFAQNEGKRQAEMFFSQNPATVLIETYNGLKALHGYATVFPELDKATAMEAQAARQAFDARVQNAGEKQEHQIFMNRAMGDFNIQTAFDGIVSQYPRSTGDREQPYYKSQQEGQRENQADIEMKQQQPEA